MLRVNADKVRDWQQRSRKPLKRSNLARNDSARSSQGKTSNALERSQNASRTATGLLATPVSGKLRKRLNAGRRTKDWEAARRWLKLQFEKRGIRTCQLKFAGCWLDNALSFCHPAKRRHLRSGELFIVCLGCTPCHQQLEVMPAADMRRIVEGLFAATGIDISKITI